MNKKQRKGVALIWAVIFSSILIIISSTMVSFIIKETQSSVRIAESSRAYSFAKSGITWSLLKIEKIKDDNDSVSYSGAGQTFEFDFDIDGLMETSVTIKSIGSGFNIISASDNKGVVRVLELDTGDVAPALISNLNSINPPTSRTPSLDANNTESFEINFNFWAKDASTQSLRIGASATDDIALQSNNNYLLASISNTPVHGNRMNLSAKIGTETLSITESVPYNWQGQDAGEKTRVGNYTGTLRYIKDTSASFRIVRNDPEGKRTCIKAISIDLVGRDLGNLRFLGLSSGYRFITNPNTLIPESERVKWNYLHSTLSNGVHLDGLTFRKY